MRSLCFGCFFCLKPLCALSSSWFNVSVAFIRENLSSFAILLNPAWTSACINGHVSQHSLKTCMLNNALDLILSSWPMLDCFNLSLSQCRPKWYYFCYCSLQLCWGNECCLGQWSYWRYSYSAPVSCFELFILPFTLTVGLGQCWGSYFTIGLFWGLFLFFYWLIRGCTGIWVRIRPPEETRTWQRLASWQAIQAYIPITKPRAHCYFKLTWITGLEDFKGFWINLGKLRPNALRALCSEWTLGWLAI